MTRRHYRSPIEEDTNQNDIEEPYETSICEICGSFVEGYGLAGHICKHCHSPKVSQEKLRNAFFKALLELNNGR